MDDCRLSSDIVGSIDRRRCCAVTDFRLLLITGVSTMSKKPDALLLPDMRLAVDGRFILLALSFFSLVLLKYCVLLPMERLMAFWLLIMLLCAVLGRRNDALDDSLLCCVGDLPDSVL